MATKKAEKRPTRVTFSRRLEDGSYENVPTAEDATGLHVHRNDATAKQFKATVDAVNAKVSKAGFRLESQESNYALFIRPMSKTAEEFLADLDSEQAPF